MEEESSIQTHNQNCLNCQSPLRQELMYCHACGQKNVDGRFTVKELFSQFFDSVFNLNSKIFKTLGAVFIPGKLTNAFLSGKRRKYYHPIRLFIVLIVISLACFNLNRNFSVPGNMKEGTVEKLKERNRLMDIFDEELHSISEHTEQKSVADALDSLSKKVYAKSGKHVDSININDAIRMADDFDFYIAVEDLQKYSSKEIVEQYKVEGFIKRLMIQQKVKMIQKGTSFIPFLMGKVVWVVFIVVLLLSLVFKLLYIRSDILYLEHLIFTIHLNAFFLIVASIISLMPDQKIGYVLPWGFLIMAIYLFIAVKRVYRQSTLKTILKFIPVLVSYFVLFIFGLILTIIGSFLLF